MRRLGFVIAALGVVACVPDEETEAALGAQMARQVAQEMTVSRDTALDAWLDALGARIVRAAVPGDTGTWAFTVVEHEDLNAFAIPGGHVYVHSGLLARAGSMAEVAGVLGHEVGHVVLRHSARQMGKRTTANVAVSLFCGFTGWCSSDAAQVAINVGGAAWLARHSRSDESEADSVAVGYLLAAGIDPAGIPDMFERMAGERGRRPGAVEAFFSSHPLDEDRRQRVAALISRAAGSASTLQRDDPAFAQVRPVRGGSER